MGWFTDRLKDYYAKSAKGEAVKAAANKAKDAAAKKKPLSETQVKGRIAYEKFIRGK